MAGMQKVDFNWRFEMDRRTYRLIYRMIRRIVANIFGSGSIPSPVTQQAMDGRFSYATRSHR